MSATEELLLELGTEELPPAELVELACAWRDAFVAQLEAHEIAHGAAQWFATPRRLALRVAAVAVSQPERVIRKRGPAVTAAFTADGTPTAAALGFAQSCGVTIDALERYETERGAWLAYRQVVPGQPTLTLLAELSSQALAALPIARRMRWGNGSETFVRPVRWVCGLLGAAVIPGHILGVPIGAITRGHRFHAPAPLVLQHAAEYDTRLRTAGWVEPDFAARRDLIQRQVTELAQALGGRAALDAALLDELAALCEWPVAVCGNFDPAFLAVPAEVLIETMRKNQKYVPVLAADGSLLPHFIAIANLVSRCPEVVRAGNERVIRPRFADAQFFWEQDLKLPLGERLPQLQQVVFQERLGSVGARTMRLVALMNTLAPSLELVPAQAERAALLAKCDLVTRMVGEFPSLQGIIGRYYAVHAGEAPEVARALEEQYLPRQAGDRLPESALGCALAIADKLDLLVGAFALGQRPSGVKDPYGLRRAAIGLLRIMIERALPLNLRALLEHSAATFPPALAAPAAVPAVLAYCLERLASYYSDQGIAADRVAAVLAVAPPHPADIDRRIRALERFVALPAAAALAAAHKRIGNLLKKIPAAELAALSTLEATVGPEPAERELAAAVAQTSAAVGPLVQAGDYAAAFVVLAGLRAPVDRFFDTVLVMTEDAALRRNRLALLSQLRTLLLQIADISRLAP